MNAVKYPRTPHLPWSQGMTDDDKMLQSVMHFEDRQVVVTEKMDGENTTIYRDGVHARSLDSRDHVSRHWVKMFASTIGRNIPEGWRICGENVYAQHSIAYSDLPSYFMGFSIWNENNICLDWETTLEWFALLEIQPVKTIYGGFFDQSLLTKIANGMDLEKSEGYVVRVADGFHYDDFGTSVAKFVRKGHVQTDKHWMHSTVTPNTLG